MKKKEQIRILKLKIKSQTEIIQKQEIEISENKERDLIGNSILEEKRKQIENLEYHLAENSKFKNTKEKNNIENLNNAVNAVIKLMRIAGVDSLRILKPESL